MKKRKKLETYRKYSMNVRQKQMFCTEIVKKRIELRVLY